MSATRTLAHPSNAARIEALADQLVTEARAILRWPQFGPEAVELHTGMMEPPADWPAELQHHYRAFCRLREDLHDACGYPLLDEHDDDGAAAVFAIGTRATVAAWGRAHGTSPEPTANRRKGPRRKADQIAAAADEAARLHLALVEDPDDLHALAPIVLGWNDPGDLKPRAKAAEDAYERLYQLCGGDCDRVPDPGLDAAADAFADAVQRQRAARQAEGGAR